MRKILLTSILTACIISGLTVFWYIYDYTNNKQAITEEKKSELMQMTLSAADTLDQKLSLVKEHVDRFSRSLDSSLQNLPSIEDSIQQLLHKYSFLFSGGVAFEPYAYDKKKKLHCPFYTNRSNTISHVFLDTIYDYTKVDVKSKWYTETLQKQSIWSEPFYGTASKSMLVSYTKTFHKKDSTGTPVIAGVLIICVSLDNLAEYIKTMDLGPGGYGSVVSKSGRYVYHPRDDYVLNDKTILDIGKSKNDQVRIAWWENRKSVTQGIRDHISTTTGQKSWFIFAPLKSIEWSLHNTFIINDLFEDLNSLRHDLITCVIAINIFIALLFWYFLLLKRYTHIAVWSCSIILSIVFILSITTVWVIALQFNSNKINTVATIHNETSRKIVEKNLLYEYEKYKTEEVVIIPTGIYLSSIESKNKSTIIANGVIWQRYEKTLPDSIQKGIQFSNAEILSITQQKVHHYTTYNLYRWNFKIALKRKLDYTKYPLDFERVNFKIQQIEGKYKVMPTPDITAYKLTNPTALPGINKEASIPGWDIMESFFTMSTLKNEVDFGNGDNLLNNFFPTLNYNFVMKRKFIDVFISNLTPLILVMFLLFIGLTISNVSSKYQDRFKSDLSKIIGFYSGLLFIVAFAHIGIRAKVDSETLFLLEYFYLIAYSAFFYVTITTILYKAKVTFGLIVYKNNLLYKSLFWPIILGSVLIVSIATFY